MDLKGVGIENGEELAWDRDRWREVSGRKRFE